jgi:hypothetical protein
MRSNFSNFSLTWILCVNGLSSSFSFICDTHTHPPAHIITALEIIDFKANQISRDGSEPNQRERFIFKSMQARRENRSSINSFYF